ncbi:MAG: efflux RND transporter periplasmic adaptor subunit [Alphaproteobacteria bacterium]|nr:efflux RND transporter periplasmic adaptor subunit [Alphaproteobacteria bacterium]
MPKQEEKTYGWLLAVVLVLALLAGYYALKETQKAKPQTVTAAKEITLRVVPVKAEDVDIQKSYIGYVTPINEVSVLPYINGFLDKIMVSGGQDVSQGETLVVIKQDEYKANMDAARASVIQAEANFANAKSYYDRIKKAGAKAVSKTEVDSAKASYLSSQAAVAQAKANFALAKVNYDYTEIQAPVNGTVGEVSLTKGDYVSPGGQALFKIIQYNPIRVVFSITDKDYLDELAQGKLFAQDEIRLRLSNGNIYAKPGQYRYVDNEIDRQTNSIAVYADFENEDKTLVANAYVDVLLNKTYKNGVLVRQNYVSREADGNYVYVVNGSQLSKVKVDIVAPVKNDYLLKNNFKRGDYLVIDKVSKMSPDQKIRIEIVGGEKK